MAKDKGTRVKRKRKLKLLRLAAIGGIIAWIVKRKRNSPQPEGIWRDYTKSGS